MKSLLLLSKNKLFITSIILLLLSLAIQAEFTTDYYIQRWFYSFYDQTWLISDQNPVVKFIFYTFPKILIVIVSIFLIVRQYKTENPYKLKNIFCFTFCMITIPAIISLLKAKTNIHCPCDLIAFNGQTPFRSILEFNTFSIFLSKYENGNCFPGGHASGGYALMSSYFVLPKDYKKLGIKMGFVLGTYMSLFQMMRGAHFFSHSLFTYSFSVLVISVLKQFVLFKDTNQLRTL